MISNVSIQEYARLAHLFRKALDESYAESKVKTTGEAGGLIRPCKGLLPASATRALKIWQSHLYYRQPPSSGGSFTFFSFN